MDFDKWFTEYKNKHGFRGRLATDDIVDKAIACHCRQTWEEMEKKIVDIDKICLIIKDEIEVLRTTNINIANLYNKSIDLIISNLKTRLERDLTTPEGEKIIKKGM